MSLAQQQPLNPQTSLDFSIGTRIASLHPIIPCFISVFTPLHIGLLVTSCSHVLKMLPRKPRLEIIKLSSDESLHSSHLPLLFWPFYICYIILDSSTQGQWQQSRFVEQRTEPALLNFCEVSIMFLLKMFHTEKYFYHHERIKWD